MNPQDPDPSKRSPSLYQMTSQSESKGSGGTVILILLLLLLAGGGAYYYFKMYKQPVAATALPAAATPTPQVASGSPTPHYNSQTEQKYIDQADQGFMAVQQPKVQAFTEAFAAFKNAGYVSAQGLTSKEAVAARRALIAKCIATNDDYAAFVATQEPLYKSELAKTPLTASDAQQTFDQYIEKAKTADVIKLRQAQHDYLQASDDMMAALEKWNGNWSVSPAGKLALKKPQNINEFNALAQKCNAAAALVTQLQNAYNGELGPSASPAASTAPDSAAPTASPVPAGTPT